MVFSLKTGGIGVEPPGVGLVSPLSILPSIGAESSGNPENLVAGFRSPFRVGRGTDRRRYASDSQRATRVRAWARIVISRDSEMSPLLPTRIAREGRRVGGVASATNRRVFQSGENRCTGVHYIGGSSDDCGAPSIKVDSPYGEFQA